MLGKASLGRQGFVVIGQGLVDAALTLRPEERRVLFEVAAGIHIYQDKRTDSLNKLAETKQNTLRLNDITAELAPRVRDLEHQARRAQAREVVSRDLEKLLRVWYGYQWHRLQLRVNEAETALHSQQEELDLHGLPAHVAEALLREFLRDCRTHGVGCVRIVHGKGRNSEERLPVLKNLVDRVLRHRADVLAFHSAPAAQGGTGAVLALLEKR